MGIVSPCSECKNQRSVSETGLPMCPRRMWMEQAKDDNADVSDFLAASGTDDEDQLANPVYLEKDSTVLVWVASLEDNRARFQDGKQANPHILVPGFDTNYICCTPRPYALNLSESELRAGGVYKEWNQLELTDMATDQLNIAGQELPINGFAKKVSFGTFYTYLIPDQDVLVPGT